MAKKKSGMPGGKLTLMRVIGNALTLLTLILTVVFIGLVIDATEDLEILLIIAPIVEAIAFILLLKLELIVQTIAMIKKKEIDFEFNEERRPLYLGLILAGSIVLQLILLVVFDDLASGWLFCVLTSLAIFMVTMVWQYTLTIYKNEKKRYFLCFILYEIIWLFAIIPSVIGLVALYCAIILAVAVVMVTVAEQLLVKQKLMNFI